MFFIVSMDWKTEIERSSFYLFVQRHSTYEYEGEASTVTTSSFTRLCKYCRLSHHRVFSGNSLYRHSKAMDSTCNYRIPARRTHLQHAVWHKPVFTIYQPSPAMASIRPSIIVLLLQTGLGLRFRTWGFMTGMVCGTALQVVGYGGRIWIHKQPLDKNPFLT